MREHFFRGKAKKDDKLYYGDLIRNRTANKVFIDTCEFRADESGTPFIYGFRVEVDPETVGEYIGIPDKYGKEIYEGDIVKWIYCKDENSEITRIGEIMWDEGTCGFCLDNGISEWTITSDPDYEYEVIGNIYDNPGLLEVEE